jgi:hypothetical protein
VDWKAYARRYDEFKLMNRKADECEAFIVFKDAQRPEDIALIDTTFKVADFASAGIQQKVFDLFAHEFDRTKRERKAEATAKWEAFKQTEVTFRLYVRAFQSALREGIEAGVDVPSTDEAKINWLLTKSALSANAKKDFLKDVTLVESCKSRACSFSEVGELLYTNTAKPIVSNVNFSKTMNPNADQTAPPPASRKTEVEGFDDPLVRKAFFAGRKAGKGKGFGKGKNFRGRSPSRSQSRPPGPSWAAGAGAGLSPARDKRFSRSPHRSPVDQGRGGPYARSQPRQGNRSPSRPQGGGRHDRSRSPRGGGGGGRGDAGGGNVCRDFQRGRCNRERCKFSHAQGARGSSSRSPAPRAGGRGAPRT